MDDWRLIDLGLAEPYMAQTFYEAVAKAVDGGDSPNTVLLVQPSDPYVCLGFHQDLGKEIDVEFCKVKGLPVIRRSQGGGATYLDCNQLFYQVAARRDAGVVPGSVEQLFQRFLSVTVYVYQKLGLPAEFKALNDVIVNGRKVSGNGAGEHGENTTILVGNIILDLDYDSMSRVLRVPDEKFRDKMAKSMGEWVSSIRRETGSTPPVDKLKDLLVEGYEKLLGISFKHSNPSELEFKIWEEEVKPRHLSHEWLYMPEQKGAMGGERVVKIADGVRVAEVNHKAAKLIRMRGEMIGVHVLNLKITGDFFMLPENAVTGLEDILKGVDLNPEEVQQRIEGFFKENEVRTPGLKQADFTDAVMKLRELAETYQAAIYPYKKEEN